MTGMLVQLYDGLRSALVLRIQNGDQYVEDYVTDEMSRNWPRNREMRIQRQMAFMQDLCDAWADKTGEVLRPVPPDSEGQEWMISPDYLEGELVEDPLQISSHPHRS